MREPTTGRDSDKFMLRLPDGMRDRIAAAATQNGRSMNSEIVARLQDTFSREAQRLPDRSHEPTQQEILDAIRKLVKEDEERKK